jgi:hypothetical protein
MPFDVTRHKFLSISPTQTPASEPSLEENFSMKSQTASARSSHRPSWTRIAAFVALVALIAIPLFSSSLASSPVENSRALSIPRLVSGRAAATNSNGVIGNFLNAGKSLALPSSPQGGETITTFAADCTTPKTTFTLGETVCAKTDNVNLSFPEPGRWVDWILTGTTYTTVYGSRTTTRITTNPQTFTYTPTATGLYKVEITEDDGNGGDNPQTPAVFTVAAAAQTTPIATYASDCATPKTSFNLGETVCAKVSGLANDVWPYRRVQYASPGGFTLNRYNVIDNSQQNTYVLPATENQSAGGVTINHLGTWNVSLIDPEANLTETVQITVHKSSIAADRVADLQASKFFIDQGDPPTAGEDVMFQINLFNAGPDPAASVTLADVTLSNTTFVSFAYNAPMASNIMPHSPFGSSFADSAIATNFVRFLHDPASDYAYSSGSFLLAPQSPLTFNCVSPSAGSAGTTTCTASRDLEVGESASFTAVYKVDASVANGTVISDDNSVTVDSATADPVEPTNTASAEITTSNPNPPACTLTCPGNITVGTNATDGGNPGAIVTFGPEAAGSCGTGITSTPSSGSFFPVGSTTVNSQTGSGASCSFVVTVVNVAQPTISCPANQTVAAPSGQSEASVTTGTPTFTGSMATLSSHRSDERNVSEPYPIGVTTITWTVTDQYGSTAFCNQTITVTSSDAPTISCPSNKTFTASSGCTYTATAAEIGTPTTTGPGVTVTKERSDGEALTAPYPAGQTYIEWTATNSIGSASCTQTITVNATDTEAPTLDVPPNINTSTDQCSVLLDDELGVATAEDNCTQSVNIARTGVPREPCPTPSEPNRTCESFVFPTGTTVITYTATDAAGNSSTGNQTVTVNESPNITPTIDAPASLTLNTGPGATSCGLVVGNATLGTATASDNCPGVVVTRSGVPAGNNFPVGTTTITYRATDRVGNFAEDTQTVTIVDNTVPVVTPPGPVTLYTGPNATACSVTVSDLDGTFGTGSATDNCPGVGAVSRSGVPSGGVFPVGTTTLTYSATDAHGNTGSATQVVTVIDNTQPVISCPANITIEPTCPTGAIATYATPTATDNCAVQSVTRNAGSLASGSVFPIGTSTVTHTATDIYGNQSSCSFTVTVKTPAQVVQDLINRVQAMAPPLTGQQSQGLVSKLNQALTSINSGNYNSACGKLGDFVTQVQNYINNGTLTSAQGQPLITSANKVRNTIGCTNLPCS